MSCLSHWLQTVVTMRWLLVMLLLPLGAAMLGSPDPERGLSRALLGTPPGSPGLPGINDLTEALEAASAEDPHALRKSLPVRAYRALFKHAPP